MCSGCHGVFEQEDVQNLAVKFLIFPEAVMKEIGVKPPEIDTTECLSPT